MPSQSADAAGAPVSAATGGMLTGLASTGAGNGLAKLSSRGNALATIVKKPKVAIVITHHNYSDLVAGAIDSALNQSYQDVDCIIVDDRSDLQHQRNLRAIFESRRCDRLRLVFNDANIGQIPSFYVGFDNTDADFVCLLDPDDRYLPTFVSEMIEAHLNPYVVAPMVCSEQMFSSGGRQLTGVFLRERLNAVVFQGIDQEQRKRCSLLFRGCEGRGWPWTSTSSMMFRRTAARAHEADAGAAIQGVRRCLSWPEARNSSAERCFSTSPWWSARSMRETAGSTIRFSPAIKRRTMRLRRRTTSPLAGPMC